MSSNLISKMFRTSLKALKTTYLCKNLNFAQNSIFLAKFGEKVMFFKYLQEVFAVVVLVKRTP